MTELVRFSFLQPSPFSSFLFGHMTQQINWNFDWFNRTRVAHFLLLYLHVQFLSVNRRFLVSIFPRTVSVHSRLSIAVTLPVIRNGHVPPALRLSVFLKATTNESGRRWLRSLNNLSSLSPIALCSRCATSHLVSYQQTSAHPTFGSQVGWWPTRQWQCRFPTTFVESCSQMLHVCTWSLHEPFKGGWWCWASSESNDVTYKTAIRITFSSGCLSAQDGASECSADYVGKWTNH